ncbi:Nop53 protein, partial [Oesophagostomum dentatum]
SRVCREPQKLPLPSPKCPSLKKQPKLKQPVVRVEKTTPKSAAPGYDLWETDFEPKLNLEYEEAGEHMLRYTKQKLPNKPSTARFKPSLLDAVAKPDAGASYNPKAEDYEKYVMKIAQDETKLMQEEERIERSRKPKHESVVTYAEKSLEETEGLVIDPRYNANDEEEESNVKEEGEEPMETGEKITISHLKRKTKKQKLNAAKEKKLLREQKKRKEIEKKQHDVFKAKNINKELAQKEQEVAEKAAKRKKEKFLKKMTTRQKLGGGEFKDEEEPFLLQEELSDSLRKLKPQGHVLNDRLASLQRRNMLPIGGPRNKNKLKTKLKRKFVEKRLVAEVTKGSRVM